jgi:hypothetical protein
MMIYTYRKEAHMSTADRDRKSKKDNKPSLQRTVEGILERMRDDVLGLLNGLKTPQRQPIPVPIPVPVYRRRRM